MTTRNRAAVLTAAFYAALFMTLGVHLPYWPVWLKHWGLTEAELGIFVGIAFLPKILGATVLPTLADRTARRRRTIVLAALGGAVAVLLHPVMATVVGLFCVGFAFTLLTTPLVTLGEALGLRASERHGFAYAPIRAAGSVAFLIASFSVGVWLDRTGPEILPWLIAGGLICIAAIGAVHPGGGAPPGAGADKADRGDLVRLYSAPVFLLFTVASAFGQGGHAVYYVYSVLAWQAQGISGEVIGALWAFGVVVETLLLLGPGRRWIARIGPAHALALAALAGIVRWGAMAASPSELWLWPLQALHALTFALAHLGTMAFLAAAVPPRLAGSAQGALSGLVSGSVAAAATFGAAGLVAWSGTGAAYAMASGMAVIAALAGFALARVWNGGRLDGF